MNRTKTHLLRTVVLILAVALIAGACGADDDDAVATNDPTVGTAGASDAGVGDDDAVAPAEPREDPFGDDEWRLIHATVDDADLVLLDTYPVTLRRDGNEIGGSAACNSYFGSITTGAFLFDGFGATEMACDPPAAMDLESAFLGALGRVTNAQNNADTLTLTGDGVELGFEVVPPTPDADLEGTSWTLDTIISGDAASSVLSGTNPSLSFDGTSMSGSDGCNSFDTEYSVTNGSLGIAMMITTTRGCDDGTTRQSQSVQAVLADSPAVAIDGDRLTFTSSDGSAALVYRAS
jgi:heat shock protein HslJ